MMTGPNIDAMGEAQVLDIDVPANRGATFDESGAYRYTLWREWARDKPRRLYVMLNPSIADSYTDDRTVGRCTGFAKRDGFGSLEVVNLFGLVSSSPKAVEVLLVDDPDGGVGEANDSYIRDALGRCAEVLYAWGAHPIARTRATQVSELLAAAGVMRPKCLGLTKEGHPRHPLYLPAEAEAVDYQDAILARMGL